MADIFSKDKRSQIMSRIRSKNTKPEVLVRSILHQAGYRFTLHNKKLSGSPDLVFPKYNKVIFVHGCFWHGHKYRRASKPKTNKAFWTNKININKLRDRKNARHLTNAGWQRLVVWECELEDIEKAFIKMITFLES